MKLRNTGQITLRAKKRHFPWFILIVIALIGYGGYWLIQNLPSLPSLNFSIPTISLPFGNGTEKRLVVLFIPGADSQLMNQWRDDLPHIQQAAEQGIWQELESITPAIPAFSWSVMATGLIPEQIYSFGDVKKADFFARNANSIIIPDMPDSLSALPVQDASSFWSVLEQNHISTLILDSFPENDSENLYETFLHETTMRTNEIVSILKEDKDDCILAVWHSMLRLSQRSYPSFDEEHPGYDLERSPEQVNLLKKMYVKLDESVQFILKSIEDENTRILIVSGGGLPTAKYQVNVNTWLWQNGYLNFKQENFAETITQLSMPEFRDSLDWEQPQVYSVGMGNIFIHHINEEYNGVIDSGQIDGFQLNLQKKLQAWQDHRWTTMYEPVINSVKINTSHEEEDASEKESKPDMQIVFQPNYTVSPNSRAGWIAAKSNMIRDIHQPASIQSYHANNGIFIANWKVDTSANPSVVITAPAILQYFGVEIPEHMQAKHLYPNAAANTVSSSE